MDIQRNTLVFKLSNDGSSFDLKELKIDSGVKNFIADLTDVPIVMTDSVKNKFITFDKTISGMNGSFVIVSKFSFDEILKIVPTLQEAYDYIEMEEMERQL